MNTYTLCEKLDIANILQQVSICVLWGFIVVGVDIWKHIRSWITQHCFCSCCSWGKPWHFCLNKLLRRKYQITLFHNAFLGKADLPCHARWAALSSCACFLTRLKAYFWHPATLPVIPPAACVPCRGKKAGDLAIAALHWATGSLPAAEGLLVWSHGRNSARHSSPRHKKHTGLGVFAFLTSPL